MKEKLRIALTGFMGVGKTSVARHLSDLLGCERVDLDNRLEAFERKSVAEIIDSTGIDNYRKLESAALERLLCESNARILSLGGGTWTVPRNRDLIKAHGLTTVWLESTFEHCWYNIRSSRKERPLARDKEAAKRLFDERQSVYCLADWHFIIRPEFTSLDIAKQIVEQVFL